MYIYIHTFLYTFMCIYIYICIHRERERERERESERDAPWPLGAAPFPLTALPPFSFHTFPVAAQILATEVTRWYDIVDWSACCDVVS